MKVAKSSLDKNDTLSSRITRVEESEPGVLNGE
jgi:hypothetical protein